MVRLRRRVYQYIIGGFAGVLVEVGALAVLALAGLVTAMIVTWIL